MTEKHPDSNNGLLISLFIAGFLIYIVSYLVSQSNEVSYVLVNVIQIFGIVLFVPSGIMMIRLEIENNYLRFQYIGFLLWTTTIVFRGISLEYESLKELLFSPISGIFMYLVPTALLFQKKPVMFRRIFDAIFIMGGIYLVLCLIFIKVLFITYNESRSQALIEYFTQHLALPMGFLLFTYIYHSGKRKWFALLVIVIAFLLAVIRARRGLIFITFIIMFFSYLIYQYVNKARLINIVFSVFIIILLSAAAVRIYEANRKSTFSLITQRISQRTRTSVEQYFYSDLKAKDWLMGKGINGKYFCPGVIEGAGRVSIYRKVIETGYLQIILNGGIVNVILLLLIVVPAIIRGLFYSKNLLSKAAGMWLVLFIFYSYPGTPVVFTFNYILVWISVGICYSKEWRNYDDNEIKSFLSVVQKPEP
jgi:hypothetical protein